MKSNALSKCAVCENKKSMFIKQQEISGLISRMRLNKIPLVSTLSVWQYETS